MTIDISSNATNYIDTINKGNYTLLHIPKENNPNNAIYTFNDMSIYIKNNVSSKSIYFNRSTTGAINQITHNDISINNLELSAAQDTLNTTNISVILKLRSHQNKYIIQDINYINYLYELPDDEIVQFLLAKNSDTSLSFWSLLNLQQSLQTSLFFNVTNDTSLSTLAKYTNGLGYDCIANVLSGYDDTTILNQSSTVTIPVKKPIILSDSSTKNIFYMNGKKVMDTLYKYSDNGLSIGYTTLSKDLYIPPKSNCRNQLFQHNDSTHELFSPKIGVTQVTVNMTDFKIYLMNDIDPIQGFNRTYTKSFTEVTPDNHSLVTTIGTDSSILAFGYLYYNKTFIIVNNTYTYSTSINLDTDMSEGNVLYHDLDILYSDDVTTLPLLNSSNIEAHLNGYYLIPDIDYNVITYIDTNGYFCGRQFILTNNIFLQESSNILEIMNHTARIDYQTIDYVLNGQLNQNGEIDFELVNSSKVYINGLLQNYNSDIFSMTLDVPNGSPYIIRNIIPKQTDVYLSTYNQNSDNPNKQAIQKYFTKEFTVAQDPIFVNKMHIVFSPYFTYLIQQINNGSLVLTNDPDNTKFINQVSQYDYIKNMDQTLSDSTIINFNFVYWNITYSDTVINDSTQYALFKKLVTLIRG